MCYSIVWSIVSIEGLNCLQDEKNIITILCRFKSKEEIRIRHLKVLVRGEDYDVGVIERRVFVCSGTYRCNANVPRVLLSRS